MNEYISDFELDNPKERKTKSELKSSEKKVDRIPRVSRVQIAESKKEEEILEWENKLFDKIDYLREKLPELECKRIKESPCSEEDKNCCSHCWWNNITISLADIPVCNNCMKDANKYKQILESNCENKQEEYNKYKKNCSRWCLWHNYFFDSIKQMDLNNF